MLTYNTQLKNLVLPEYGRNIQQMVDHCVAIADRVERTRCAYAIIEIMGNLFPNLRDEDDFKHKLWDHLVIMSDFKLDIDFPCEVISVDNLCTEPTKVEYKASAIKCRHYGKYVEQMVDKISTLDDGVEKDSLILLVANHMKKMLLAVNKDGVDDSKIFRDLYEYSNGKVKIDESLIHLHEFKEVEVFPNSNKKKKKNKN